MVELCFNLKGNYLPYQLSFNGTLANVSALLLVYHTQRQEQFLNN